MRLLLCFIAAMVVASCSSTPQTPAPSGWQFNPEIGQYDFSSRVQGARRSAPGRAAVPSHWHILYLSKVGEGRWEVHRTGDTSQLGTEAIYLDPDNRLIGLAAAGTELQTNGQAASVCAKVDDYDRFKSGYLACNSELVSTVKDLGVVFLPLKPLMSLTGTNITAFKLNRDAVSEALSGIDLDLISEDMTAIYEYQQNAAKRALAEERFERQRQTALFQQSAGVGTKTLCGIVVGLRGPLVEVELYGGRQRVFAERSKLEMPRSMNGAAHIRQCARTFL